jgi:predicted metal-dependent phosphoesterase TrpH
VGSLSLWALPIRVSARTDRPDPERVPGLAGSPRREAFKVSGLVLRGSVLLDLHNHTYHSPDSRVAPADLVARARRNGLGGLAVTDHNSVRGIQEAEAAAGRDFVIIPAIEVSTRSGHILAYGVRREIPRDLSVAETVERIVALGGVPVAAHPYRFWSGLGEPAVFEAPFPAFETCNSRTLRRGNARAAERARERGVGQTGGSDSHFLDEVARAVTVVNGGILGVDDVLQALGQGRTSAKGINRGATATVRYVSKCVGEWLLRGMRRI